MTRRASRLLIHALGASLGVATVLLAALAWRLAQGPVALDSVTPYIEAAVNDRDFGFRIQIDEAELIWGDWQETFEIRTLGVRVLDDRGVRILAAQEVVLEMALPPLIRGEIRPRGVMLVRPRIAATRGLDGAVRLVPAAAFETGAGDAAAFGGGNLADGLLSLGDRPPFDRLVRVELLGADLLFDDRVSGLVWDATAATVSLARVGDDLELDARMLLRAERQVFDADIAARYTAGSGEVSVSCGLADFLLGGLPRLAPRLPDMAGLDIPVDGRLELVFDDGLELLRGSFHVETDGGTVALEDVFEAPLDIGPSRAQGFIRPGFSGLELADLDLGVGVERLRGRVAIDGFGPDSRIEARIDIDGLPVDDLSRYWPVGLAPNARAWVVGRISDGAVDRASIAFAAPAADLVSNDPPSGSVVIDLDVSDASVDYLPGLPPARGVDGRVAIVDDMLRVDTSGGRIEALTLARGIVTMSRLDGAEGMLIGVELSGPIANALDIAGREPLALSGRVGLDPGAVDGRFDGRLDIVLPRLTGLEADEVLYRVAADANGVALAEGPGGYRINRGSGVLSLDAGRVLMEGDIRLNGVPFAASYRQDLAPGTGRVASLRGAVDDAGRAALGFADPVDMTGPVDIVLDMSQAADGTATWNVVADLTRIAADLPIAGVGKAAGEPGRAAVRLVDDGGAELSVEALELDVGEISVRGVGAVRSGDMSLARLDLGRLRFGRNDVAGVLSVGEDGVLDIALAGGTVDLEPVLDRIVGAAGSQLPPFRVRGRIDRLWITDDDSARDVRIDGLHIDGYWESLAVAGATGNASPVSVAIWRSSENQRRFEYNADDAGAALRLFGLLDNVNGGTLRMRGRIDDGDPERPVAGAIGLEDFVVRDAPVLTRILSLASFPALVNALTGDGLAFNGALIPFRKAGNRVAFQDARLYGPGLGVTFRGRADLDAGLLDLDGTIVPAYLLNTVIGELPLIGDILTGAEEGGGVFAFTFGVEGPLDGPEIAVNPLSVLAPGFLRNLFTAPTDDEVEGFLRGTGRSEGGQ